MKEKINIIRPSPLRLGGETNPVLKCQHSKQTIPKENICAAAMLVLPGASPHAINVNCAVKTEKNVLSLQDTDTHT